jgi:hypothetical protein
MCVPYKTINIDLIMELNMIQNINIYYALVWTNMV